MSRGGVLRRAGSTPHEPDLQPASQLSLSDTLAPRRQRSRSIHSQPSMRRVPVSALRARAQMPVLRSRRRLRVHSQVPSSLRDVHHRGRRPDQIPIAPAAQPVPNFPRLRALALFGRRSTQQAVGLVMPASKNLHNSRNRRSIRSVRRPLAKNGIARLALIGKRPPTEGRPRHIFF